MSLFLFYNTMLNFQQDVLCLFSEFFLGGVINCYIENILVFASTSVVV